MSNRSVSEKYVGFRTMYFSLFKEIKEQINTRENGVDNETEFYNAVKTIMDKYENHNFLP